MNVENAPSTTVDIPELIRYLEHVDAQNRKSEVNIIDQFRKIKCFHNMFGSTTSFKLIAGFYCLKRNFSAIINPLGGGGSSKLCVTRCPEPATFGMSVNIKNSADFLTFVNVDGAVTVFAPDIQEPIGKIVRRKAKILANDEADIFCFATNMKFTMKNIDSDPCLSMKILDSTGNGLGAASVTKLTTRNGIQNLVEFAFHFDDGISEPTKVMFLVAFTNWAMWAKHEINGRDTPVWVPLLFFTGLIAIMAFVVWIIN